MTAFAPFPSEKPAVALPPAQENAAALFHGKKILLAEDNAINRMMVRMLLTRYGAHVTEAEDGHLALALLQEAAYDLVLMDVQMPRLDGLETTRIIRKQFGTGLPVIALSACAFPGEQEKCLQAGMNDFICKPFEEARMIAVLADWLERQTAPLAAAPEEDAGALCYDLSRLESLCNGNKEFIRKMVRLFIQEIPASVEKIRIALHDRQPDTIRYIAHRIHPACHNLGITRLAADIKSIEALAAQGQCNGELQDLVADMERMARLVVAQLRQEL